MHARNNKIKVDRSGSQQIALTAVPSAPAKHISHKYLQLSNKAPRVTVEKGGSINLPPITSSAS